MSKIVIYNPQKIYQHLNIEHPLKYIEGKRALIDRTGTLDHWNKDLAWIEPLPIVGTFAKTFEEVVFERAQAIAKTGLRINVLWSGGIDSTVVLYAMLQICESRHIRVIMNHDSILESGTLFEDIRRRGIKYYLRPTNRFTELFKQPFFNDKRNVYVTGVLGDQIYGMAAHYEPAQYLKPWKDIVPKNWVEYFEPLFGDITLGEFCHHYSLNFNWQALSFEYLKHWPRESNISNFYSWTDFQRWSLCQDDPLLPYRYESRRFIAKYSRDADYALNKQKAISLYGFDINWLYYTDDHELVNAS